MKKIVVPTDFSDASEQALLWAKLLAQPNSASLTLLHVSQPYIPDTTLPTGEFGAGVLVAGELEAVGDEQLKEKAAALQHEGFTCDAIFRIGSVEDEIIDVSDELNPDLIVMGRHQFDTFFDRLAGSAATDVAMQAHCPVLVVPAPDEDRQAAPVQVKHVVYTTQLEFDENDVLRPVVELARQFEAKLTLLKVEADNQPNIYDDSQFLRQIRSEFGQERFHIDKVHADSVSEGLTDYVKHHHVDVLVMATRERDFLSRLLNPSLTKRMVTSSPVPLLVYHAKENY